MADLFDWSLLLEPSFFYASLAAALGGLLLGFTGFGSTLVMVPLLTFIYGPAQAVAVGVALASLAPAQLVPSASKEADWPDLAPACLMSLFVAPVGIYFLLTADPGLTRRLMGVLLVSVALIMINGWNYKGPRSTGTSLACGAFTAFTNGYFGMGAPGVTIYYLSDTIPANVQRANILILLCVASGVTLVGIAIGGGADWNTLLLGAALFLPFSIPMWIGERYFRRTSSDSYRRVCLWLLIVMGVVVVVL